MIRRLSRWAGAALALFAASACGDDSAATKVSIELDTLAYTTAKAQALQPAIEQFQASHPDVQVEVVYGGAEQIGFEQSMTDGRPPDVFQSRAGRDMLRWVTGAESLLEPLDSIAADPGYPAGVLGALSAGGRVYGAPFTIERDNTLYYNKKVFADAGLTPPGTLADFIAAAETIKGKGVIPLALGSSTAWSIAIIAWPWLLVEEAGAGYYADFFAGNKDPGDVEIRNTLQKLAAVLRCSNYRVRSAGVAAALAADAGASDPEDPTALDWQGAADLVIAGKAAMTVTGDFAKAYLMKRGLEPDVDFGEMPAPGTAKTFVFFGTAFGLPKKAKHPAAAADLVKILGSAQVQAAFNAASGTIPASAGADRTGFDPMEQRRMDDLASATAAVAVFDTIAPRDAVDALDDPLRAFADDNDIDRAVAAMKKAYAAIKSP